MKRLLLFLIVFYGIIGNSWAVCELTESTDRTPSDEDLYPQNPNESRMALICQKGKCGNGEIVYMDVVPHYIGNVFNSEGFTTVKDKAYYKCKLGGNARWLEAQPSDIRTRASYIDPTLERPMIEYDDNKGLFVYGTKASDGNYYTNLLYVEPDERCGVKCTPENENKIVYCDGDTYYCDDDYGYRFVSISCPFDRCQYYKPNERIIGKYTFESEYSPALSPKNFYVIFGVRKLLDGEQIKWSDPDFCLGCVDFYAGDDCRNNEDEAWCAWRKNKDGKNTEWTSDDKCKCLDNGMEWSTEQHDCIETKGGGKTGGGKTGSGKTGGGKTGSGKQSGKTGGKSGNGTTSDTKCGKKCNAQNSGKNFYCLNDGGWGGSIYHCDSNTMNFRLIDVTDVLESCSYSDPLTRIVGTQTFEMSQKTTPTMAIFGPRKLEDGEEITKNSGFCGGCTTGAFFYFPNRESKTGWCTDSEQHAWCWWQYSKANMNVEWRNDDGCKCLDSGKKWDAVSHTCVPDGTQQSGAGQGTVPGNNTTPPQNTKIECSFNLGATVKCRDGVQFSKNVSVSVLSATCDTYKSNVAKYVNEIAQLLCESRGGVGDVITNARLKTATDNLDKFFESTKSNPNVWKDADGKFNTARLASDATAGVVLGTVGGIVSAHVIKKKQLEKGFDALQCTIGKQKVADFGDEFTVGLRH